MRCLNLGCGSRFHVDWENVDFVAASPVVRAHDLRKGIPYGDAEFEAVYHSHVLEHFGRAEAAKFLRDCYRVLKPGGVIRVAVPDLEQIARLYLSALEKSDEDATSAQGEYDWMMLELYDQTVREQPGGEMLEAARKAPANRREFLKKRLGGELERMLAGAEPTEPAAHENKSETREGLRRRVLRLLVGDEGLRAFDVGRFRLSGEVHRWMYDFYSLGRALEEAGFQGPRRVGAAESRIPGWERFHLDTEADGRVYKPDSLYMEATRG